MTLEWVAAMHRWGPAVDQAERETLPGYAAGCPNANLAFARARGDYPLPRQETAAAVTGAVTATACVAVRRQGWPAGPLEHRSVAWVFGVAAVIVR